MQKLQHLDRSSIDSCPNLISIARSFATIVRSAGSDISVFIDAFSKSQEELVSKLEARFDGLALDGASRKKVSERLFRARHDLKRLKTRRLNFTPRLVGCIEANLRTLSLACERTEISAPVVCEPASFALAA